MANQIERDVYVTKEVYPNPISYVRGTNALPIVFHFLDYDIPDGASASVAVIKPSGHGVYNSAEISGNDVKISVDKQMFIEVGTSELQVTVSQGDADLVTFAQPVWVKPNYKEGDFPPSESSSDFLDDILKGANEAVEKATEALSSAETAISDANAAVETANQASQTANQASQTATEAATTAEESASAANQAAADAQTAVTSANEATEKANSAIQDVHEAIQDMNTNFASLANTAEISTLTTDNQTASGAINELMAIKAPGIPLTATGEQISMDDASGNKFLGLWIYGRSKKQSKTTGAQLFDASEVEFDMTLLENGSSVLNGSSNVSGFIKVKPNTVYSISAVGQDRGKFYDINKQDITQEYDFNPRHQTTFTTTPNTYYIRFCISKKINTIMVNEGYSVLPWEPYTGGFPSPSTEWPQEVDVPGQGGSMNVNVYGGNLFDYETVLKSQMDAGLVSINEQGKIVLNGTANPSNRAFTITLQPGTYYFSADSAVIWHILIPQDSGFNLSLTVPEETTYTCYINSGTYNNQVTTPMINKGSSPLPWEAPKPVQTLPITTPNGLPGIPVDSGGNYVDQNGQQWISDVRDEAAGKYTQMVEVLNARDMTWNSDNTGDYIRYSSTGHNEIKTKTFSLCNRLTWNQDGLKVNQFDTNESGKIRIWLESTIDNITEFFEQNNTYFVLQLAIPIVTDLPAEETAAYNALHTNNPNTNIFTDQDVQPGMEAEYVGDTKIYVDKKFQTLQDSISNLVAEATANFINNANVTDITQLGTTSKTLAGAINELNNK